MDQVFHGAQIVSTVPAVSAYTLAITTAGGDNLKKFVAERSNLRARRSNIDLGTAGLAERSTRILESLADIEEATQRHIGRLDQGGVRIGADGDDRDAVALGIGDEIGQLRRFAAPGQQQQRVLSGDGAHVAMTGFGRMDEHRRRAGGCLLHRQLHQWTPQ